jgi:hypothetical protein
MENVNLYKCTSKNGCGEMKPIEQFNIDKRKAVPTPIVICRSCQKKYNALREQKIQDGTWNYTWKKKRRSQAKAKIRIRKCLDRDLVQMLVHDAIAKGLDMELKDGVLKIEV